MRWVRQATSWRLPRQPLANSRGQATVEAMLVGLALLAVIGGLAALGNRVSEGILTQHASASASHALGANSAGTIGDVLLY